MTRLADVAEIRFSNVDKKALPGELQIRLCNYMDVYGNHGYITKDLPFMEASASSVEIDRFRVECGDVLLTKDSETPDDIGIPAVVMDEIPNLICGYHLALIKPRRGQIDSVYLAKQLGSQPTARHFSRLANGSTRYGLSSSSIACTPIPHTPLSQQRRIAEILSTVDEAIEQTEVLIAKYQQIKAGLMHDLFTRGVTPDGKLRPPRNEAPHLYKDSPLGWIPKEWDCFATEDKVRVIDAQPDHRTPPEDSEGYPYIGIGDISPAGEVMFGQARRVLSTAFTKQLNSFEVEPGAFIFGKIGTLGSPTRIPHERFFAISANVVLLTSKVSGDVNFTFWIYHSQWIERQISDATNTTSQPALGIQKIRKFMLPWPSTSSEREVITSRLENMLQVHQSLEREKHKMILLKQGLMHDLLTGRVRVNVAEAAIPSSH